MQHLGLINQTKIAILEIGGSEYGIYSSGSIKENDFDIRADLNGNGILGE